MAALPGLGYRQALVMTQASTALSMVTPAGAAVGMAGLVLDAALLGLRAGADALAVAVTGVWNQFANLVFPVVALVLLTGIDQDHPALRTSALVGLAVLIIAVVAFALALSSADRGRAGSASRVARLANRVLQARAPRPRHLGRRGARAVPLGSAGAPSSTVACPHARRPSSGT